MDHAILSASSLPALADAFLAAGYLVVSDAADGRGYRAIRDGHEVSLDSGAKPGRTSFKQFLFPKTEPIFYYRKEVNDISLVDPPDINRRVVILGAKPCDAKSPEILAKVFNWDYHDAFFNRRVANTVVIGLACTFHDEFCFCTSVGLSPVSEQGSDVFLVPLGDGSYGLTAVTDKGHAFLEPFTGMLQAGDPARTTQARDAIPVEQHSFCASKVREWIDGHFDDPAWQTAGAGCLGCAQCAFVCPVCHCFDIVDEDLGYLDGMRMKNWDACQAGLFTKHASGHNPRENQTARYRQRVSHKFAYYPEKFGEILCTGCGRCSRGCAAGVDIAEVARTLASCR